MKKIRWIVAAVATGVTLLAAMWLNHPSAGHSVLPWVVLAGGAALLLSWEMETGWRHSIAGAFFLGVGAVLALAHWPVGRLEFLAPIGRFVMAIGIGLLVACVPIIILGKSVRSSEESQ